MKPELAKQARSAQLALLAAAGVGAVALWLSYFASETVLGFEADKVGFSLFWIAVTLGLVGVGLLPPTGVPTAMTIGEKRALISLAVTLFAGAYLVMALHSIGWDADPRDRRLLRVVAQIATLLIASGVLLAMLRRREVGMNVEDERDAAIRQRAANLGYQTLTVLLVIFAVTVGYSLATWYPFSRLTIAHSVIGILMLSEVTRYAAEVWLYRRDRT